METFVVKTPTDWYAVAAYLLNNAAQHPLDYAEADCYSDSEEQAWEKARRLIEIGHGNESLKYSALVLHHSTVISLVATFEPTTVHLSMVQVLPGPRPALARLTDAVATEAATAILGRYQEKQEGVSTQVRHFYRHLGASASPVEAV